jgi:ribulose-phosphate 3-epimerase
LVMTVNPGFGGQAFIPETLDKIRQLRALIDSQERPIDLMVDGGVNVNTAPAVVAAGSNILVVGSAVFSSAYSIEDGMKRLRAVLPA